MPIVPLLSQRRSQGFGTSNDDCRNNMKKPRSTCWRNIPCYEIGSDANAIPTQLAAIELTTSQLQTMGLRQENTISQIMLLIKNKYIASIVLLWWTKIKVILYHELQRSSIIAVDAPLTTPVFRVAHAHTAFGTRVSKVLGRLAKCRCIIACICGNALLVQVLGTYLHK